jgi:hypothetical protein
MLKKNLKKKSKIKYILKFPSPAFERAIFKQYCVNSGYYFYARGCSTHCARVCTRPTGKKSSAMYPRCINAHFAIV